MLWLKPTKARLRQYKKITVSGLRFTIQKLNPLLDFSADKMPQVFTYFVTRRKPEAQQPLNEAQLRRQNEDIKNVICAGIIKPEIGKDISIDDIMTDMALATRLYTEIVIHSLNMFKGLKGLFFSTKTRRLFYTECQKNLDNSLIK